MASQFAITVCTMRRAGEVAECLAALLEQASPRDVGLVLSGLDSRRVAEHRAGPDVVVLTEARPGLSHARNRALDWAARGGADVLAFVDDDALVAEGWLEALRAAWDEAPPAVACIGGPIRPRYSVEPPAWLSSGITHTLTLLDRGPAVRDVDPESEAVYGANISFRVAALRRIGGFDPSLGHAGERVFFGEEDEAERALVRLGFRVRYVPDAAVLHVIPPERLTRRSFLRRRFAYGAALGRRRGRTRRRALVQALSSGIGALLARGRGDEALAMERAVRAAENAGVIAGARIFARS